MLYARAVAASTRPGPRRLLALAPVLALLVVLPLTIPLYGLRGLAAFFLVWLGEFKLLLLAFGHGPLHPSLRPLPFVFTASLPVKLRRPHQTQANATAVSPAAKGIALPPLVSSGINIFLFKETIHPYASFSLYGVAIYCYLDSLLPCLAIIGTALGMEMEPQFDKPYLSSSLQDFWGRRWNLMVSAILRPSVYDPVRSRLGAPVAVLATFLVSGLMHEVVVWYLTFRAPTGQLTAFFTRHGACVCAERWWCGATATATKTKTTTTPRVVATLLVVGFVAGTAFWLFFPAIVGDGMGEVYLAEMASQASFFLDAGGRLLRLVGLG
ncbi:hypothetical protein HU200_059028 [Digitaria exilis]|uniref:Wax synthase domain-containing protein n=1 Tax=Digitaria exilis TaxID=1010633 RepID=A0A835ACR3_9POAL|nr:hypothetical protein HU200_059028 [Digitaria exilis]